MTDITISPDAMSSVGSLTRAERDGLATRPDWSPVYERTVESVAHMLDALDATVITMLESRPCTL